MGFTYESYRKLKGYLGQFDAINELNELAIREINILANQTGNIDSYIRGLSKKHNIRVDFNKLPEDLSVLMAKNYIVVTYQSAELFLEEYKSESQRLNNKVWTYEKDSESKLTIALKNTNSTYQEALKNVGEVEVMLFEYYRYVRVAVVHRSAIAEDKLNKEFKRITKYKDKIRELYNVNGPNNFNKVNFDDFILFSRVIKKIAHSLCELGKPSTELIAEAIDYKKFKKFTNDTERLSNAIKGELGTRLGITGQEANLVLELILEKISK